MRLIRTLVYRSTKFIAIFIVGDKTGIYCDSLRCGFFRYSRCLNGLISYTRDTFWKIIFHCVSNRCATKIVNFGFERWMLFESNPCQNLQSVAFWCVDVQKMGSMRFNAYSTHRIDSKASNQRNSQMDCIPVPVQTFPVKTGIVSEWAGPSKFNNPIVVSVISWFHPSKCSTK